MKLSFSANAFRKYGLADTMAILASIGYDGLEVMADTPHAYPPDLSEKDYGSIRLALQEHGIAVSNINAFMMHAVGDTWHPSWIEQDPDRRSERINHTLNCIDLAEKIGAPSISTEPGGPLDGMDRDRAFEIFLDGLSQVRDRALEKGVKVLIEPEPGLLVENSSEFRELFRHLDPHAFGLNFDIGHFYCVGEDPVELIHELKSSISHFHLEDIAASRVHHHLMPGEGNIDLKEVLRAIREIGYTGFITVELYPYEDRPVDAAKRAMEYLRAIL